MITMEKQALFQPALPMRGVAIKTSQKFRAILISTRTPHAGSDRNEAYKGVYISGISTRTPHAGSDLDHAVVFFHVGDFNPHSPCGE